MTLSEFANKMAVLLGGEDAPKFRARLDEYAALHPPPPGFSDAFLSLTADEFDAAVEDCGGAEEVRRSARAYYGVAD
jgi:hypothetical protein